MIEYKCPYCGQDSYAKSSKKKGNFTDWKSVRSHISKCVKNSYQYMICEFYGPIKFSDIEDYKSIYEFTRIYPQHTFHESQWKSLRLQNKLLLKRSNIYTVDKIISSIKNFYFTYGQIPQARDFRLNNKLPNEATVQRLFGSWNIAIEAAGFTPNNQNGFGINTYAKDGKLYRSTHEAYFVDNFLYGKYNYQYELPYGNGWYYDFYIKELGLYIELDGGLRPQRIEEKRKFHLQHGVNCRIIKTSEIYKKDFCIVSVPK